MPQLRLDDSHPDKCDFFSDIDENTNMDVNFKYYARNLSRGVEKPEGPSALQPTTEPNFKYYDTIEINNMAQSLNLSNSLSILHTNIQSLNCNGEKLESQLT